MTYVLAALFCVLSITSPAQSDSSVVTTERVGRVEKDRTVTPVNQIITPYGTQLDLPGMRPQALALSPNGKLLAVSGKTSEVLIVDPATGQIQQYVAFPSDAITEPPPEVPSLHILQRDKDAQLSFTGLIF